MGDKAVLPFIEIFVTQQSQSCLSEKKILKLIQQRIFRTHHVEGVIIERKNLLILRIEYPTEANMSICYQYGVPFLKKIHDIIEKYPNIPKFKSTQEENQRNYLSLRYRTNYKPAMRKVFNYAEKIAQVLNSQYAIEEIEDGFLMYYGRPIDFLFQQLDRKDYTQVKKWMVSREIDVNQPAILEILEFLKEDIEISSNVNIMHSPS